MVLEPLKCLRGCSWSNLFCNHIEREFMKVIRWLTSLSLLVSCTNETWTKPETHTLGCTDYLTVTSPFGTLYNNVWNKKAAKSKSWSQCLEKKIGHDNIYGWSWQWPITNNLVYAYPQIKVGNSPWDPQDNADSRFPLKISELKKLNVSHDVHVKTNGQHNLATSMWLVDAAKQGKDLSKQDIVAELMIWTYTTPEHFNPAGKLVDTVKTNSHTWELWVDKNWGDISGENDNKWTYVTFRAKNSNLKSEFDALKLLNKAIDKGLFKPTWYIADIELGTEIMSGSGLVWINSFNVQLLQ